MRLSVFSGTVFCAWVHEAVKEAPCLGSNLLPCPLSASSPLGFAGPKPALISWLERKKEVWSPEAEDPEEGARHPGSGIGEESGAELEDSLSWERARAGPFFPQPHLHPTLLFKV